MTIKPQQGGAKFPRFPKFWGRTSDVAYLGRTFSFGLKRRIEEARENRKTGLLLVAS